MAANPIDPRGRLRELQDELIALCDARGMNGDLRLSVDEPSSPTLREMRMMIFPQWQGTIERVLSEIKDR